MLTLYKMKIVCGEWTMLAHYGGDKLGNGGGSMVRAPDL